MLVYSIESRQSFNELEIFYQQILRMKDSTSFPMIIVGTKCDLEFQRQVPASGPSLFSLVSRMPAGMRVTVRPSKLMLRCRGTESGSETGVCVHRDVCKGANQRRRSIYCPRGRDQAGPAGNLASPSLLVVLDAHTHVLLSDSRSHLSEPIRSIAQQRSTHTLLGANAS